MHSWCSAIQRQKRVTAILTLGSYAFLPLVGNLPRSRWIASLLSPFLLRHTDPLPLSPFLLRHTDPPSPPLQTLTSVINIPTNASSEGSCKGNEYIRVFWPEDASRDSANFMMMTFVQNKTAGRYHVDSINVQLVMDDDNFPDHASAASECWSGGGGDWEWGGERAGVMTVIVEVREEKRCAGWMRKGKWWGYSGLAAGD